MFKNHVDVKILLALKIRFTLVALKNNFTFPCVTYIKMLDDECLDLERVRILILPKCFNH